MHLSLIAIIISVVAINKASSAEKRARLDV